MMPTRVTLGKCLPLAIICVPTRISILHWGGGFMAGQPSCGDGCRRWIAARLDMWYETRVSQAVSWVELSRLRAVVGMRKKRLESGL